MLGYMSHIGCMIHTGGNGNDMDGLRCMRCSAIGMRGLWVHGQWCEWPGRTHDPECRVIGIKV